MSNPANRSINPRPLCECRYELCTRELDLTWDELDDLHRKLRAKGETARIYAAHCPNRPRNMPPPAENSEATILSMDGDRGRLKASIICDRLLHAGISYRYDHSRTRSRETHAVSVRESDHEAALAAWGGRMTLRIDCAACNGTGMRKEKP